MARFWPRARALVGELCLIRCGEYAELWIRGQLMREMTEILAALERDESQSAEQLLRLVYEELCRFAARHLAKDAPGQTLQPTALVQLGVSVSTAERLWAFARAWLYRRSGRGEPPGGSKPPG